MQLSPPPKIVVSFTGPKQQTKTSFGLLRGLAAFAVLIVLACTFLQQGEVKATHDEVDFADAVAYPINVDEFETYDSITVDFDKDGYDDVAILAC